MNTAAKSKMAELVQEAQGQTKRTTQTTTTAKKATTIAANAKFADIASNTFFKIIFSKATPEEKKKAFTEARAYDAEQTKEQNAERLKEFDVFKEYLQDQSKVMAQKLLALSDTGTFGELKQVIEDMNNGLLEFDQRMQPLTEILDAVYTLTQAGSGTFEGVFKEIQEDKAAEAQRQLDLAAATAELEQANGTLNNSSIELQVLKTSRKSRTWLGFGGLKESAIRDIAAHEQAIADASNKTTEISAKVAELSGQTRETQFQEFQEQKQKLSSLLDITSETHTENQKALVASVQSFIDTSSEKTQMVQGSLEDMKTQITGLADANDGIRFIYAIMSEADGEAMQKNDTLRTELGTKVQASTSEIEKMTLEQKKANVDDYLTNQHNSAVETAQTLAELTSQSVGIKNMGDTNRETISMIRELGSSGVSGMANRLAMAVNAVGAAATKEAGTVARMSINSMNQRTNEIVTKEAIKNATGLQSVADNLETATNQLLDYRALNETTKSITSEKLALIREKFAVIEEQAAALDASVKDSKSARADVLGSEAAPANQNAAAPAKPAAVGKDGMMPSPF